MKKLLISACLLGEPCRYDGKSKPISLPKKLTEAFRLVPICPEVLGGLATPRPPCECQNGHIVTKDGKDFTKNYQLGAKKSLEIAIKEACQYALLKEKSPSCGVLKRYDGTFTKCLINESGITADLLKKAGLKVFSEEMLAELLEDL